MSRTPNEVELTYSQTKSLITLLRIARDTALGHARTLDQCAASGGNAMVTAEAAQRLASVHQANASEAIELIEMIDTSSAVWVQY